MWNYTPPIKPDQVLRHNPDQLDGYHFDDIMQKTVSRCPGCGSYGERHTCEYCGTVLNVHLQNRKETDEYKRMCKEVHNTQRSNIVRTSSGGAR